MTIRVHDVVGVAGFVLPGPVGVVVTRRTEREETIADIVMQNIKVLGIDQDIDDGRDKPTVAKAVTVEVTPEQAQKLALAQQVGQLTLALRNEGNVTEARAVTVGVADLSAGGRPVAVAAPGRPAGAAKPAVPVVRGLPATREEVPSEPPAASATRKAGQPLPLAPRKGTASDGEWVAETADGPVPLAELGPTRGK
jgi:pilus assembly protein CpaB